MATETSIVWFRNDLRIADNPALRTAVDRGHVVPVFIWSPEEEGQWRPGGASRWWLFHSLRTLQEDLRKLGSRLIIRSGNSLESLRELVSQTGATAVYWNRTHEPAAAQRDQLARQKLLSDDLLVETFNGNYLYEPGSVLNKSGAPYRVFTPFWKTCVSQDPQPVVPEPRELNAPRRWPASEDIEDLNIEPTHEWTSGLHACWTPGERQAKKRLRLFAQEILKNYHDDRNRVDIDACSRLSPHLRFGEISPRQVRKAVLDQNNASGEAARVFMTEIGWREFACQLLVHFPETTGEPLQDKFRNFPWSRNKHALKRWQQGQTGFPIVDAAMRNLWSTGWMPNRARMIVASFLTKNLLIPWQDGARWFWDTLVDADLANNTLGWQWTAGCGADAAPFFRVFNPVSQSKKFDPDGLYVRKWIPEIAALPQRWIACPWEAPKTALHEAGIKLGKTYPNPIVDHADAREAALAAYSSQV